MKKHLLTLLVAALLLPMLGAMASAQEKLVFAGRAIDADGKKVPVTVIGDVYGSDFEGRLVVGGYFVGSDATGIVEISDKDGDFVFQGLSITAHEEIPMEESLTLGIFQQTRSASRSACPHE